MDYPRLITKILLNSDVNQVDLARHLKVTQPTISRWKSGLQKPEHDQKEAILAYAATLGILDGSEVKSTVPIIGTIGVGAEVSRPEDDIASSRRAGMPPTANRDTVALVVQGDNMLPMAENGWIIYYDNTSNPPSDEIIGKLCVVTLRDGRVLVKSLYKGREPDTWDLHAPNASPLLDQAVQSAAKVTWIKPN